LGKQSANFIKTARDVNLIRVIFSTANANCENPNKSHVSGRKNGRCAKFSRIMRGINALFRPVFRVIFEKKCV